MVGVDGSEGSRRALRGATREAVVRGAVVQTVAAWRDPHDSEELALLWTDFGPRRTERFADAWRDKIEQKTRERLGATVADVAVNTPQVEVELVTIAGDPASKLCQLSAIADPLVVGPPRRHGLAALLFGLVSNKWSHDRICQVVILPD